MAVIFVEPTTLGSEWLFKLSIALNRNDCLWRKFFSNAKQRKKHHITC